MRSSRLRSSIIMAFLALGLAAERVTAQVDMSAADWNNHLSETSNQTIVNLVEAFKPHFPASKLHLLDADKFSVAPLADFNAYARPETGEIIIPLGIVHEMHLQALGYIYTQRYPSSNKHYNGWLRYLAERSERVRNKPVKPGEKIKIDDEPILNFWTYAKLPSPGTLDDAEADVIAKFMISALGLVLGHELGHLVFNHTYSPSLSLQEARLRERAADEFGADLVRRTFGSAIAGLQVGYLRFVINEELFRPFKGDVDTHPQASCRLSLLLKDELEHLFKSKAAMEEHMKAAGLPQTTIDELYEIEQACIE